MVASVVRSCEDRQEVDLSKLRFVSHRRATTAAAAKKASRIARWICTGNGIEDEPDETALFESLHTCGYRATKSNRGRSIDKAERRAWARRWKVIRDHVVEQNLGLAYSMLARFRGEDLDWDDLRSEALLALVRAVEGFSPWRGFRFSTYACSAVNRSLVHSAKRSRKHRVKLPAEQEISMELASESDNWSDLYTDRLERILDENRGDLTDREAMVIGWRFPRNGAPRRTLGEVGEAIGLSKERVRQIQQRALEKLRGVLETDPALQ